MTDGIISASYGRAPQIQDTQVTTGTELKKGFNLWNRILTESEIVEEANTYDRGMRYGWSHCEVEVVVQEVTQEEFY